MNVLVTGSFGNVGSHLLPELLREGHRVRCLDLDGADRRRVARGLGGRIEVLWGDVRDASLLDRATDGVEAVVHLAARIPPGSEEAPEEARAVNVGGTAALLAACRARTAPPRLLFTSTFDVHGRTQDRPPPRRAGDPLAATDGYTAAKIEAEALVQGSGLPWCILRLTDVPVLGVRDPHPIMFEIGLHNRIESLHADDAATALARALRTPAVWGRILMVGGGPSCQLTYGEYLARLLAAMGVEMLPAEAFAAADYVTDWVDSDEAERLLAYRRRGFDRIAADVAAAQGWRRRVAPLAGPLVQRSLLALSRPWRERRG